MRGLGITLAALVALAGTARADDAPLDEARRDVDNSDYLAARTQLTAALAAGTASPDELAEIYKLTGIVEAAVGDASIAQAAFGKWLALDPKAALPAGTSPKITRPFDAARKTAGKLEVKTETTAEPPSVTLVVVSDPIGIVRARVHVVADGKPEEKLERDGKGKITVELPRGKRLDLRVEALDAHGNEVAVLGSREVPIVITGSEGEQHEERHEPHEVKVTKHAPPPPAEPRSWYASHRTWGIATAVAALGTGAFAYLTYSDISDLNHLNATSLDHPYADAQGVESRARRDLFITDVGAALTGAFAIGTAILYFTRPQQEQVQVSAVPARGGGALVIGGSF
ncbi:MAG: hypothetical protein ACM31C_18260 [Acidobacteriota bacterium]